MGHQMDKILKIAIIWALKDNKTSFGSFLNTSKNTGTLHAAQLLSDFYIFFSFKDFHMKNVVTQPDFRFRKESMWYTGYVDFISERPIAKMGSKKLKGFIGIINTRRLIKRHFLYRRTIIHTKNIFEGIWDHYLNFRLRGFLNFCLILSLFAHYDKMRQKFKNPREITKNLEYKLLNYSKIIISTYVFWMGDQNFRLDQTIDAETIAKKVAADDLKTLTHLDELRHAQKEGDAFAQLTEGELTFPPTYKYGTGKSTYDLARRPAWTDRILHQVHVEAYENIKLSVEQTRYTDVRSYTQSDHKPVVSDFKIKVFANHEERCVHFQPVVEWVVGEGGKVTYSTDADVTPSPWDYIALYKADFSCVHQYITYTYAPQAPVITSPNTYAVMFNDELVQDPGEYVLLYYSGKYTCYLAMSERFHVVQKEDQ
ncbi:unnamed protein product, partial [Meganyctiphanes norvegica]